MNVPIATGPPSQPLHVAIVSTQKKWHGGEMQAALLAEGLSSLGHQCSILCRAGGEFAERMQGRGFHVSTFPGRGRSPLGLYRIRKALRTLRPDVVHANDAHALTGSGIAGLGLRIPLRVVARRVDFPLRAARRYERFSDGLICVSTAVEQVCRRAGIAPSKLHVVHDGVDPAFAESGCRDRGRKSLKILPDNQLLLTVAKLTDHKGHVFLLRAMPRILAQYPMVRLALAGDGELRGELQQQVDRLGIQQAVQFLGYRHDVPDLLSAADVIVQPSHMEGLCSSLIDAMLAARPIVATEAGGIPDLLATASPELPVAWLVPPKSPADLTEAVVCALHEEEEATSRGLAARARAQRCFTAASMVDGTLDAYAAIAQSRYGHQAASRVPGLRARWALPSRSRSAA